jgi:hypothetical protein
MERGEEGVSLFFLFPREDIYKKEKQMRVMEM